MNQGGHGSVSSSLGAGTKQCSWSLPAATADKQSNPSNISHQMNICKTASQNFSIAVYPTNLCHAVCNRCIYYMSLVSHGKVLFRFRVSMRIDSSILYYLWYAQGSHPCLSTKATLEHVFRVSRPLICSRPREIRTRTRLSGMEKSSWDEHLQPVGVYYEGVVDDATTVVERLTAETVTTFGTRRSRQPQPSEACKENISVNNQDDEVSNTQIFRSTGLIRQWRTMQ